MDIHQLNDNRWVGCSIAEIVAFPSFQDSKSSKETVTQKHMAAFALEIQEFFRLSGGISDKMMELLWCTERIENQTFRSRIRLFFIIRSIGSVRQATIGEIKHCMDSFLNFLSGKEYQISIIDSYKDLEEVFPNDKYLYAVTKKEICTANAYSPMPYYFCGVIPDGSDSNFEDFISALSQQSNCCVSFQLFPTHFTQQECYLIREMTATCNRFAMGFIMDRQMVHDVAAKEPGKVYNYYAERLQSPLFQFSILAYGGKEACDTMTAKAISLLQSGRLALVHSDFGRVDLSPEQMDMKETFLYYPWNVNNKLIYYYRNQKLQSSLPVAKSLMRLPYIISSEEASCFFRLPLFEQGMTALKNNAIVTPSQQFDEAVGQIGNIQLGKLPTQNVAIGCPLNTFTKHALIVGVPGSGKTTFAFYILMQLYRKGIPFLAIEPTKAEYRGMIDAIPELQIFTPGNSDVSPFILNPFIPPHGVKIEQYIPSLASAFKAAFSMPSPLDVIFMRAIRECYTKYGWKDYSKSGDEEVTPFGLYEFVLMFKKLISESTYSREVRGNLESGGVFRLLNLIEQNRNIYDTIHTIPIEDILSKPTVIELNAIENAEQKALIMALLLINICSYTKANHAGNGILKNAILIDEAHVLLGGNSRPSVEDQPDARGTTVKAIQDMIAEIRSYGTSLLIADQSPAKVSREVVAQTEIKIAFRLVQSVDKELIADTTNMEAETANQLAKLKTGEAYVYYSKLDSAQLIITPDIREQEGIRLTVPDQDIKSRMTYWEDKRPLLKPYQECKCCSLCEGGCEFKLRADADHYARRLSGACAGRIRSNEDFLRYIVSVDQLLSRVLQDEGKQPSKRLIDCVRIKFYRNIQLETPFRVPVRKLCDILLKKQEV